MRVALVSMPFGMIFSPSIALGLLKQLALLRQWDVSVHYFNLKFAKLIGDRFYNDIASRLPTHSLVGEWVFSDCFPDSGRRPDQEFIEAIVRPLFQDSARTILNRPVDVGEFIAQLLSAKSLAAGFVKDCARAITAEKPELVGITSVFQQHAASIALAREIRALSPSSFIVMGGANCEGVMGQALSEIAPWIDRVVSGEGERAFDQILSDRKDNMEKTARRGAGAKFDARQDGAAVSLSSRAELDALPIPEYSDYFRQLEALELDRSFFRVELPFETARGCWWGEKHHCTFCGLNGEGMAYRSKSPDRAYVELIDLIRTHPGCRIAVTDNILDMKYLKTLLPRLTTADIRMEAFWEVKSNLAREHLQIIRSAGVTHVQPGIESLSDSILELMRKGVRAIQNVQLLVDCAATGITPGWNILWGFPGEAAEEYRKTAELLPSLFHLQPPVGAGPVGIHRFSPMFQQSAQLGVGHKLPAPAYRYAFPFAGDRLEDLAYFFDGEYACSGDVAGYTMEVRDRVDCWKKEHESSVLVSVDKGTSVLIIDTRSCRRQPVTLLSGLDRQIFDDLSRARKRDSYISTFTAELREDVENRIDAMLARRILVEIGAWLLVVAVPLSAAYQPTGNAAAALVQAIRETAVFDPDRGEMIIAAGPGRGGETAADHANTKAASP